MALEENTTARAHGVHGLQQADQATDVVVKVLQRLGHAFANGLEAGQVNDRRAVMAPQYRLGECGVKRIAALANDGLAGQSLQSLKHLGATVGKIVKHDWHIACLQQCDHGVAADVASAAG